MIAHISFSHRLLPALDRAGQVATLLLPVSLLLGKAGCDIAFSLLAILFLLRSWGVRDATWMQARWFKIAAILWAYLLLRSLFAEDAAAALARSLPWIRFPVGAAALAYWTLQDNRTRQNMWISLTATISFLCVDAFYQFVTGADLFGKPTFPSTSSPRLTGPYSAPKIGIVLAWIGLPVIGGWLAGSDNHAPSLKRMGIALGFSALLLVVIFLSGERMALLLYMFGLGLFALLLPISRRLLLAAGLACAALLAVFAFSNQEVVERQMHSTLTTLQHIETSPYGQIWLSAKAMIEDKPIAGVGPRHFRIDCIKPEYGLLDNLETRCNLHPHHLYLEWLVESGIVGLALFLWLIAEWGRTLAPHFAAHKQDTVFTALLVAVFLRLWPLSTSTSFFTGWSAVPFWLLLGWLLAIAAPAGHRAPARN